MRAFFLGLIALLVFLPAILILLAPGKPLAIRIRWGLAAFFTPIIAFGLIQFMPALSNNAPQAMQFGRLLGLILAGSGLILPWLFFATFLNRSRRPSGH
ncbi:MAG: hypothetical protein O9308_13320 [Beijerinckiaceae bacterium]|nr:hypothetical protein [Beijerinckiaceae bacterium]